ncbi:protein PFC0760c-like [Microplitis demolitor]|uniref:protein PFC0760c-like n=1 Tax=Microplitis demolitor TaxID=69319 RepID=UPI00235B69CC|nr:protein PFC0760c-like [Microplitis demolitor]
MSPRDLIDLLLDDKKSCGLNVTELTPRGQNAVAFRHRENRILDDTELPSTLKENDVQVVIEEPTDETLSDGMLMVDDNLNLEKDINYLNLGVNNYQETIEQEGGDDKDDHNYNDNGDNNGADEEKEEDDSGDDEDDSGDNEDDDEEEDDRDDDDDEEEKDDGDDVDDNEEEKEDDGEEDEERRDIRNDNLYNNNDLNYEDESYERPVYEGSPITVADSMMVMMSLAMKHNLSDSCIDDIFEAISLHCPKQNLQKINFKDVVLSKEVDIAGELLDKFVDNFEILYGVRFASINLHQLRHLLNDVRNFRPL